MPGVKRTDGLVLNRHVRQLGCHQFVQLRVLRKLSFKRYEIGANLDQSVTAFDIGNVFHLVVADLQELRQFLTVGAALIEHDNELAVRQHRPRCVALQKVVHILCDAGTVRAVLAHTLPKGKQEIGAVILMQIS